MWLSHERGGCMILTWKDKVTEVDGKKFKVSASLTIAPIEK
jgi:hypothetical protein